MRTVNVAVPVLKGRTIFTVDKGRPWSVVEHLLLQVVVKAAGSSVELSDRMNLPRRIVLEGLIRLMRTGWVEVVSGEAGTLFRATARGVVVADESELPRNPDRKKRPTNYVVDLVSGEIFRNRDLVTYAEDEVQKSFPEDSLVWLAGRERNALVDPREAAGVLLDSDETFVGAEPAGVFPKFVVVRVQDGRIVSGLPDGRELDRLRSSILRAADGQGSVVQTLPGRDGPEGMVHKVRLPRFHAVRLSEDDLILDGEAHLRKIRQVLDGACTRVFVHSTFISRPHTEVFLDCFEAAVNRGATIHVLWGQEQAGDSLSSTQKAIADLRRLPRLHRLGDRLIFHPYSTGSHAKLLIADTGAPDSYEAVVGSCNWLVSSFSSYEVSVATRNPHVISDIFGYLALISSARDGVWTELASEIVHISRFLDEAPKEAHANAQMAFVVGEHHERFVHDARDTAQSSIFVASHRLGATARPGILEPLLAAESQRTLNAQVFYGRRTGPVTVEAERELQRLVSQSGLHFAMVEKPRLHAKVLAWDDDFLLATSLNWLSAEQGRLGSLSEAGLYVCATGIASRMAAHFRSQKDLQ